MRIGPALRLLAVLALLSGVLTVAPGAQALAAATDDYVSVDLGVAWAGGMVYHDAASRIVVALDDEVQIFTVDGVRTARIIDIFGAFDPEVAGDFVVVGSNVGELIVIDPISGWWSNES